MLISDHALKLLSICANGLARHWSPRFSCLEPTEWHSSGIGRPPGATAWYLSWRRKQKGNRLDFATRELLDPCAFEIGLD
ncbi:hypothetical protein ACP70R_018815 [Stipagrostis hirtigluma subsp. patula]